MKGDFQTGDLRKAFTATSGLSFEEKLKILDENYARRPDGPESIGRIATSSYQPENHATGEKRKKQERNFSNLLYQLQQQRVWLLEQMKELQGQIEQWQAEIEERARNVDAIKDCLEKYRKTGQFELDSEGYPANPRVKELLKQWEKAEGKKWDAHDPAEAQDILIALQKEEENRQSDAVKEREIRQEKWEHYNEQRIVLDDAIGQVKEGRELQESTRRQLLEQFEERRGDAPNTPEIIPLGASPPKGPGLP